MTVANWNDQNKNCFSQLILSWNQTIIVCFLYVYKRVYLRILKLHWNNLCVNVVHSINYFSFFKTVLIVENNYISYCLDYMYYITLHLLLIVFAVDYVFQIHRMFVDFENLICLKTKRHVSCNFRKSWTVLYVYIVCFKILFVSSCVN